MDKVNDTSTDAGYLLDLQTVVHLWIRTLICNFFLPFCRGIKEISRNNTCSNLGSLKKDVPLPTVFPSWHYNFIYPIIVEAIFEHSSWKQMKARKWRKISHLLVFSYNMSSGVLVQNMIFTMPWYRSLPKIWIVVTISPILGSFIYFQRRNRSWSSKV